MQTREEVGHWLSEKLNFPSGAIVKAESNTYHDFEELFCASRNLDCDLSGWEAPFLESEKMPYAVNAKRLLNWFFLEEIEREFDIHLKSDKGSGNPDEIANSVHFLMSDILTATIIFELIDEGNYIWAISLNLFVRCPPVE